MSDHPAADYGPAFHRLSNGEIKRVAGAAEVEIADRPDPDRPDRGRTPPVVRGARRYDGVQSMFGDKSPEFKAAERFRDDCAIASGARPNAGGMLGAAGVASHSGGPSDAVLDALARVGDAWHAMGASLSAVVAWVILGNGSIATYERGYQLRHGAGSVQLRSAVERLMGHYATLDDGR